MRIARTATLAAFALSSALLTAGTALAAEPGVPTLYKGYAFGTQEALMKKQFSLVACHKINAVFAMGTGSMDALCSKEMEQYAGVDWMKVFHYTGGKLTQVGLATLNDGKSFQAVSAQLEKDGWVDVLVKSPAGTADEITLASRSKAELAKQVAAVTDRQKELEVLYVKGPVAIKAVASHTASVSELLETAPSDLLTITLVRDAKTVVLRYALPVLTRQLKANLPAAK